LFETAIARVPADFEEVKELKSLGHCFAQGVKQVKNITPLFEAGSRKCLILSDNDAMAREHQKEYREGKYFGVWKRYDEVHAGTAAITGEDFIKETAFKDAIDEIKEKHNIATLNLADLNRAGGKICNLRRWLMENGVEQTEADRSVRDIKEAVFESLKNSEIKSEYYDYLKGVLSLVRSL
jgi:hypothetical protein